MIRQLFFKALLRWSSVALIHKKWVSVRDSYRVQILSQDLAPFLILAYAIAMDHARFKDSRGFTLGNVGICGTMNDFTPRT